jgi:hypothetical protein
MNAVAAVGHCPPLPAGEGVVAAFLGHPKRGLHLRPHVYMNAGSALQFTGALGRTPHAPPHSKSLAANAPDLAHPTSREPTTTAGPVAVDSGHDVLERLAPEVLDT